jgi:Kef-type K+ transport system membrane component KefB
VNNTVFLLMGLLVLSYLGSFLMTRRTVGRAGLPSGVEFAALGFVLGPQVLGIVGAKDLTSFEPVVQVAIGWLAFAVGMDFGSVGEKRVRPGSLVVGSFGALLTGAAVGAAVWFSTGVLHADLKPMERVVLAAGTGAACSETTRYAIHWVAERYDARGPLADLLNELAHADSVFPLVAVALIFALEPTRHIGLRLPLRDWPAITIGLGLIAGAGAALLLRTEMPIEDTWGVLFGVSLLAIGTAARLGLSTLTATFFMGLAISALSRHSVELRSMMAPTERPVLLPALLLAGARLDFHATPTLPWIAAAAIGARMIAKIVVGWVLVVPSAAARRGGPLVGLSLMSSGALAMCIGLAFALHFPGPVGDSVLVVAVLSAVVGEFVGPVRMRRALQAAGEIRHEATGRTPQAERATA